MACVHGAPKMMNEKLRSKTKHQINRHPHRTTKSVNLRFSPPLTNLGKVETLFTIYSSYHRLD